MLELLAYRVHLQIYQRLPQLLPLLDYKGEYELHILDVPQNYGYDGYDASVPMWETWEEAVADEDKSE